MLKGTKLYKALRKCRDNAIKILRKFKKSEPHDPRFFILGTEDYGNLGDHHIAVSVIEFLKRNFPDNEVIEITAIDYYKERKKLIWTIDPNDIIIMTGGGNFGNVYPGAQMIRRDITDTWKDNHKVVMPVTVYYEDNEEGNKNKRTDRSIFTKENNIVLAVRDQASYEIAAGLFQCEVLLVPDIVFASCYTNEEKRSDTVVCCLRSDLESAVDEEFKNLIKNRVSDYFDSCVEYDLQKDHLISKEQREKELKECIQRFKTAKLVITDRLHGMIFSAITGTPCIVIGNYNHKIRSGYDWVRDFEYMKYLEQQKDPDEILKTRFWEKEYEYDSRYFEKRFSDLVKAIKKIRIHKFIECSVPIKACNMRCQYCYVTQNKWWSSGKPDYSLCMDKITEAFSVRRLGGTCMFNMCAMGETLIDSEVLQIAKKLIENGHFVMIVTNGTLTERFSEACGWKEELRERLFFKISFHYLELKRINKLEEFFGNIKMLHEAGISYTVELTPDDCYIPYIDEIRKVCEQRLGALCHVTVPRDETKPGYPLMTGLSIDEFDKTWKDFDSPLFDFKRSIFEIRRKEFCYAGMWSFVVNILTGDYSQCYRGKSLGNLYEDLSSPIKERAVGCNCPEGHCFNGHAFLGFGLIPELETPYFADMRNRITDKGGRWLGSTMESAMRSKLIDDNRELKGPVKVWHNIRSFNCKQRLKDRIKRFGR